MKKTTKDDEGRLRVEPLSVTKVAIGLLGLLLSAVAWVLRRTWKKYREEREMLLELYAFNFGADELDMNLEDESVKERLESRERCLQKVAEGQHRIVENQERIVDRLEKDVELRDLPADQDRDRYRDQRGPR